MSSRWMFAVFALVALSVGAGLAAEPTWTARVKLGDSKRLDLKSEIVAIEGGQYTFVKIQDRAVSNSILHLVDTKAGLAVTSLPIDGGNPGRNYSQANGATLFYDAKRNLLTVPTRKTVGVLSTDRVGLEALIAHRRFLGESKLPASIHDHHFGYGLFLREGDLRIVTFRDSPLMGFAFQGLDAARNPTETARSIDIGILSNADTASPFYRISPDGRFALLGLNGAKATDSGGGKAFRINRSETSSCLMIADLDSLKPIFAFDVPCVELGGCAFDSANATIAIGGSDGTIRFIDVKKQTMVGQAIRVSMRSLHKIAFSPDGKYAVALTLTNEANVFVVEVKSGKILASKNLADGGHIIAIAFDFKGERLLSLSSHSELFVWDFNTIKAPLDGGGK